MCILSCLSRSPLLQEVEPVYSEDESEDDREEVYAVKPPN